jgi:hypothetical protein
MDVREAVNNLKKWWAVLHWVLRELQISFPGKASLCKAKLAGARVGLGVSYLCQPKFV